MRYLLFAAAFWVSVSSLSGQHWTDTETFQTFTKDDYEQHNARSLKTKAFELKRLLFSAPEESNVKAEESPLRLTVPTPEANVNAIFRIVSYQLSGTDGTDQFAHIRTWYGVNEQDPQQTIFLDWTEQGFHASIRGAGRPYFIDPAEVGNSSLYVSYFPEVSFDKVNEAFICETLPDQFAPPEDNPESLSAGDCVLRQYRIAVSATNAYSNFHGATSVQQAGLVHSAIVTTLNRVNQIYTRELSVRLQLIPNNDTLYFYSEVDNPYSDNAVSVLINENIALQRDRIGNDNFDIGHVFTQGENNGRGFLRSGCDPDLKGGGATSLMAPQGDPFDVDYVAHEIGHQLGANHTQNNACNYSPISGMEPGSGSTIMGYAGICTPNIQQQSDDYFHGRSIEEITEYVENIFTGGRCATIIDNSLFNPIVSPVDDYQIPHGTPFKLTGQATGNGAITYNWEQFDVEQAIMPPVGTSETGPLFRSFAPTESGERFFPKFETVLNNETPEWEAIPEVGREMNFHLTVRNNGAAYGCAGEESTLIEVDGEHGPFVVTDPSNSNQWSSGQVAQIQWDVAGTDAPEFNSPTVDILLSADGGSTFLPLAVGVPNNGFTEVTVPEVVSTTARLMVRSSNNIFYNLSKFNFSIVDTVGTPAIALFSSSPANITDCFSTADEASFSFITRSSGGATDSLLFTVTGMPEGVTARFSPERPRPGGLFTVTLAGLSTLPQGEFTGEVIYDGNYGTVSKSITVNKIGVAPRAGPDGMVPAGFLQDIRPTLSAEDNGGDQFQIQLATDASFSNMLYDRTGTVPSYTLPSYLSANTRYHWRIRSLQEGGGCGISLWNNQDFITGSCPIYVSSSPPVEISTGPPPQISEMVMEIREGGILNDLDLVLLDIEHSYLNDVQVELESPEGNIVTIFDRSCGGNNDILMSFDDEAASITFNCPPVDPTAFVRTPNLPLSMFDEEEILGNWTIRVTDNANQDGGQINGFALKTCIESSSLPIIFLSFKATGRKNDVLLSWATEAEENNAGFYVERTPSSTPDAWVDLGFVPEGSTYQFVDATVLPATNYLYRLRQIDTDGRVSYSDIRSARIGGGETTSLQVYPNPTNGQFAYRWLQDATLREATDFQLTDARGRLVREGRLQPSGGSINLEEMPSGIYFLRVPGLDPLRVVKL
ncbi:MAG: reprolysin-like metallopeptidase [Lewinella sp.]